MVESVSASQVRAGRQAVTHPQRERWALSEGTWSASSESGLPPAVGLGFSVRLLEEPHRQFLLTPVVNEISVASPAMPSTLSSSVCLVRSTCASLATLDPSGVKKVSKWPRKACIVVARVALIAKEDVKSSERTVAVEVRMSLMQWYVVAIEEASRTSTIESSLISSAMARMSKPGRARAKISLQGSKNREARALTVDVRPEADTVVDVVGAVNAGEHDLGLRGRHDTTLPKVAVAGDENRVEHGLVEPDGKGSALREIRSRRTTGLLTGSSPSTRR